jgi:hypothetical protein
MGTRTSWATVAAIVAISLAGCAAPDKATGERLAKLEAEVSYLRDRQAIRDVIARYVRGTDRHDPELIRSAFWPDAKVSYGRPVELEEFVAWGIEAHAKNYEQNAHHITVQNVEIDGNVAHVESYVVYFLLAGKKSDENLIASGRYIEKYEKRNGEWRIAIREFIRDVYYKATPLRDLCPEPQGCMGKRDRTDLSYLRPLVPQEDRPDRDGQPTATRTSTR